MNWLDSIEYNSNVIGKKNSHMQTYTHILDKQENGLEAGKLSQFLS